MKNGPIGIFDSGVGGLTVFREIRRLFPYEDIVYFGDTARLPYGTKSPETIVRFALKNINFLKNHDVKVIVIACNTASAVLLNLKKKFRIPVINVIEPGARQALLFSRNKKIGVIGTESTIQSRAYEKALRRYNPSAKIFTRACPLFVPLIEEDWVKKPETKFIVKRYLSALKATGIDALILGCTHYPLLKPLIQKEIGREVKLIDSAREVAKELDEVLKTKRLPLKEKGLPRDRFFVSDLPPKFRKIGERFLGRKLGKIQLHRL
ncbi:MAG: glutamate racemase [Candidatus Ratteibacteria bacterium]|nr:glutamate racemase [Candidatus Ratteibacteria bacterium]